MLRRSHAMAPLRPDDVSQLLDSCAELAAERHEPIRVLQQLRHTSQAVQHASNEMATIVAVPTQPPPPAVTSLDHADHVYGKEAEPAPERRTVTEVMNIIGPERPESLADHRPSGNPACSVRFPARAFGPSVAGAVGRPECSHLRPTASAHRRFLIDFVDAVDGGASSSGCRRPACFHHRTRQRVVRSGSGVGGMPGRSRHSALTPPLPRRPAITDRRVGALSRARTGLVRRLGELARGAGAVSSGGCRDRRFVVDTIARVASGVSAR